jgi:hypothetical protein
MKVDPKILLRLQILAQQQRGVLTNYDLEVLFKTSNRQLLRSRLLPYLKSDILIRFCRGFYITPNIVSDTTTEALLEALSQRINPFSVISLGTVLSKARLIGTVPKKIVYAVKVGTTRKYENETYGQIIQLGFGGANAVQLAEIGSRWENGIRYAEPEKALLDTLYFYQRGNKVFFNVYSDIFTERINRKKYLKYLEKYPNSRFKAFAGSYINEQIRS